MSNNPETGRSEAMSEYVVKSIDEMHAIHHGIVKLAGAELGVESFGIQVLDFPAGFVDYPEHDHSHDGQEEVYLALRGSAEFEIDGERVSINPGRMVRIGAGTKRRLEPGPDGVRILAIGCSPGRTYERPEDFRLAVRS
jgi:mannose-6-phosphate isomerase-like protein (cupin superfamily)